MSLLRSALLFILLLTLGLHESLTKAVFKPLKPEFYVLAPMVLVWCLLSQLRSLYFLLPIHPEIRSLAVFSLIALEDEMPWGLECSPPDYQG